MTEVDIKLEPLLFAKSIIRLEILEEKTSVLALSQLQMSKLKFQHKNIP